MLKGVDVPVVANQSLNLTYNVNLRDYLPEKVIVGFSASSGQAIPLQVLRSWNFSSSLDLPATPIGGNSKIGFVIGLVIGVVLLIAVIIFVSCVILRNRRRKKVVEEDEDEDEETGIIDAMDKMLIEGTGPKRFAYKELVVATHNFSEEGKLGQGGFGGVYREWEQCVLHRDIKSSNVMLDSNFNTKLGDFGLARMVEHVKGSQTTALAGTMGYMSPECVISGKASKESDIYSFGIVALEIACGRKAIETKAKEDEIILLEWVWELYERGKLLDAADAKLCGEFDEQQMERLMTVGLWCGHPDYNLRPSIRKAFNVLDFEAALPFDLLPKMLVPTYVTPSGRASTSSATTSSTTSSIIGTALLYSQSVN
ncbi:hypothetical protein FH972_004821 [Carpinus fangiana]|uniref:Protein kinase domain-containing protein n=1 Tax=Carpinus fangiana TaxID=176857 RepID=A0A5N6QQQ0_9ROSI|nr:hypothetical protein FH972_004821 [Carpinus fangiana]